MEKQVKKKRTVAKSSTEKKLSKKGLLPTLKKCSNDIPVKIKTHKDKKGGHPHVILENIDKNHVSVGLSTRATKGKGSKNYRLEKSPLNDGKNSFMRRQGTVAPIGEYENPRKGAMTKKDYAQAKIYGERAKQKYVLKKSNECQCIKHKP